jgi:hypothetical protein
MLKLLIISCVFSLLGIIYAEQNRPFLADPVWKKEIQQKLSSGKQRQINSQDSFDQKVLKYKDLSTYLRQNRIVIKKPFYKKLIRTGRYNENGKLELDPIKYTGNAEEPTLHNILKEKYQYIIKDAERAAQRYYESGNEKYAVFATDIFLLYFKALIYTDFADTYYKQTVFAYTSLGSYRRIWRRLGITFDYIEPYLRKNKGERAGILKTEYGTFTYPHKLDPYIYDGFRKIIKSILESGQSHTNWETCEYAALITSAMAFPAKKERDFYMAYYFNKRESSHWPMDDTIRCYGNIACWPESWSYQFMTNNLIIESVMLADFAGYEPLKRYPILFKVFSEYLRYRDPSAYLLPMGDSARLFAFPASLLKSPWDGCQNVLSLTIFDFLYRKAKDYGDMKNIFRLEKILATSISYARKMKHDSKQVAKGEAILKKYGIEEKNYHLDTLDRSDKIPYASYYLQRNINNQYDKEHGLMLQMYAGQFNHNHFNGSAMELYGPGGGIIIDPGIGYGYPFVSDSLAHNTVIVNNTSGSKTERNIKDRFATEMNQQLLLAMEPMPRQKAISKNCQFTQVYYYDENKKSRADQQRLMALVRTSPKTGFYVDVFRSVSRNKGEQIHDYFLYFGRSGKVEFLDKNNKTIEMIPTKETPGKKDYKHFSSLKRSNSKFNQLIARFSSKEKNNTKAVTGNIWLNGGDKRSVFQMIVPSLAFKNRDKKLLKKESFAPGIAVRNIGPTWDNPFVGIFEFTRNSKSTNLISSVKNIKWDDEKNNSVGLVVSHKADKNKEIIIATADRNILVKGNGIKFNGRFAVISQNNKDLKYIYMGAGQMIEFGAFQVKSINGESIGVNLTLKDKKLFYSSTGPFRLSIKYNARFDKEMMAYDNLRAWYEPRNRHFYNQFPLTGELKNYRLFYDLNDNYISAIGQENNPSNFYDKDKSGIISASFPIGENIRIIMGEE